ncbi:MAG: ABC transporter substrate-binding protein [Armatimonadota bacterium]
MSQPITSEPLRLALVDGPSYTPLYARLDELTRDTGTPVEIVTRLPLPELIPHLREQLAVGEPYHLISAESRYTASLAPQLFPLDELLWAEEVERFSALSRDLCTWDGRLLQAPRSVETRLLFYRSDIFDDRREQRWFAEASEGRSLRVPQTWEELAAVAQYFTRAGKMHGFAFPGTGPDLVAFFAEMVTTVGGTFFDWQERPRFFSRAGVWCLTLLRDLYSRWEAVPAETPDCTQEDVSELFRMGNCAMALDRPNTARLLCDPTFSAVAAWHGVALAPASKDGRRAVWTGCPTFAVPRSCPDPAAAAELLRFLTGPESQHLEAQHGAIPTRTDVYSEVETCLRSGTISHLRFTLAAQTLRMAALAPPKLPEYTEIEALLAPLLRAALTGDREPADALEEGQACVEALLGGRTEEGMGG